MAEGTSTPIADFIDQAWNDHASDAASVAQRLPQGLALLAADPAQAGAFAQLAEHVLVGHLADADAMQTVATALKQHEAGQPTLQATLARTALALRLLRGEPPAADGLPTAAVVRAHGVAALGFASRRNAAAARSLMRSADALAAAAAADGEAQKALAAGWNNIALQLESEPRHAVTDPLMMDAAQRAREAWTVAGTWVHVERADYYLARCAATLGDGAQSLRHAQSCLSICVANDADAYERFFGHEAIATARLMLHDSAAAREELAQMQALLAGVPDDSRGHCQDCIDKLAGRLA